MTAVLRLRAPAKVNLALRVLGRRPDGYHELRTLFHAIDLEDQVVATVVPGAAPGAELTVVDGAGRGLPVAAGEQNLVVRAARAVVDRVGATAALRFHLTKRIPAGGGLGGGSSDAAAALRLTNRLLGDPLAPGELAALAVRLGADVPFFLVGGTCVAGGVGEVLVPVLHPPRLHLVLVLPPFGTPTGRVFELLGARLIDPATAATVRCIEPPTATEIAAMLEVGNDLLEPAMRCSPGLRAVRDTIRAHGVEDVRMSGSGSTLFVATDSAAAADAVEATVRAALAALPVAGYAEIPEHVEIPGHGAMHRRAVTRGIELVRVASAGATPVIESCGWPTAGSGPGAPGVGEGRAPG